MYILVIAIKVLLIPCYYSTDFDVHKNWMRITQEKSIDQWYYDDQSIWTLDYPPLFAYFEYILGKMTEFLNINLYETSDALLYFQRISVIVSEFLYFFALKQNPKDAFIKQFLELIPFGALLIDNIHFQYNGFLYGLLLLACFKFKQLKFLQGSIIFTILLCFKHIYIYVAPAFAICLLANRSIKQIILIAIPCIILVFLIFLPFLSQLPQVLSRLFPFQRGLVHAYWAPNIWSIYCFIDLVLGFILKIRISTTTSGVVQQTIFNILPNISPILTLLIIVSFCFILYKKRNQFDIYQLCTMSSLIFFNFGYHVHEKAIMIPIILSLVATHNAKLTFLSSFINSVSLLPLIPSIYGIKLFISQEQPLLIIMLIMYHVLFYVGYRIQLSQIEEIYILIGFVIILYSNIIHPFVNKFEFLPLILYSIYGAIFNQYWLLKLIRSKNDDNSYKLL